MTGQSISTLESTTISYSRRLPADLPQMYTLDVSDSNGETRMKIKYIHSSLKFVVAESNIPRYNYFSIGRRVALSSLAAGFVILCFSFVLVLVGDLM